MQPAPQLQRRIRSERDEERHQPEAAEEESIATRADAKRDRGQSQRHDADVDGGIPAHPRAPEVALGRIVQTRQEQREEIAPPDAVDRSQRDFDAVAPIVLHP